MTSEALVFLLGGVLLLIGIVGGGFELKELKIPKVGRAARVASTIAGVIIISAGLGMSSDDHDQERGSERSNPAAFPAASEASVLPVVDQGTSPASFTVFDSLGEKQISEQVTLVVNGKVVGNLTINQDYPSSMMRVTVPRPGSYSYTAEVSAVFDDNGEAVQYQGVGQGMLDVTDGGQFDVTGSVSGDTWLVTLVDRDRPR